MLCALLCTLLCAGRAGAEPSEKPVRLYAAVTPAEHVEARAAAGELAKMCWYSSWSRSGPRPRDVAKCKRAQQKLLALGSDGAHAALAQLDRLDFWATSRLRLYDVVARSADGSTVEPLIAALQTLAGKHPKLTGAGYEGTLIEDALRRITFTAIGERAPWDQPDNDDVVPAVAPWRAWQEAHVAASRDVLIAERTAEARRSATSKSVATAFIAARFLALQPVTRNEGVAALKALARRPGLEPRVKTEIDYTIEKVPPAPATPDANARA